MDLVTGILVFSVGLVSGLAIMYARNKWDNGSQQAKQELNRVQQEHAQLKQDWQDHLASFKSVATNLNEMSNHIQTQIEDAESLLNRKAESPAFPFFSKEATQFLQSAESTKRDKVQVSDQPLDYSGKSSGVFQGVQTQGAAD